MEQRAGCAASNSGSRRRHGWRPRVRVGDRIGSARRGRGVRRRRHCDASPGRSDRRAATSARTYATSNRTARLDHARRRLARDSRSGQPADGSRRLRHQRARRSSLRATAISTCGTTPPSRSRVRVAQRDRRGHRHDVHDRERRRRHDDRRRSSPAAFGFARDGSADGRRDAGRRRPRVADRRRSGSGLPEGGRSRRYELDDRACSCSTTHRMRAGRRRNSPVVRRRLCTIADSSLLSRARHDDVRRQRSVDQVLKSIALVLGARVERQGDSATIHSNRGSPISR